MGIFSRNQRTEDRSSTRRGEVGIFLSPHSTEDTLRVVYLGLADQLSSSDSSKPAPFEVSEPGIFESIFISKLDDSGITVSAGNATRTYFEFHVELTITSSGTEGHARFDPPRPSIERWMGNAMRIASGVELALRAASVNIARWKI